MWDRSDNQEVGLEAAILERVRNSSLVKWFRADNVAGLKHTAEAVALPRALSCIFRGAGQGWGWVGERRVAGGAGGGGGRGGALWRVKRRRDPAVDATRVRMQA